MLLGEKGKIKELIVNYYNLKYNVKLVFTRIELVLTT